jgi:hypothetical protein
VGDE